MKINDIVSINLEHIVSTELGDNKDCIWIYHIPTSDTKHPGHYKFHDHNEGKGFAERTKARIDAYFEMKERKLFDYWEKEKNNDT